MRGRFRLLGLPGGSYGATATYPGLGSDFLGPLAVPGTGALKGVAFRLGGDCATTLGRVLGIKGKAVEGLRVFALRESQDAGDIFYAEVAGDRYRLSLSPGSYTLRAEAPGWSAAPAGLQVPGAKASLDLRVFPEKGTLPALADELVAMARADQAVRNEAIQRPGDATIFKAWHEVDTRNETRLKAILAEHGWPTATLVGPKAARAAWLMVQHASAPFLKTCLPFMKRAAERGEISRGSLALSIDRDLMYDGKKQIYGSQFRTNEKGELEVYPIEDEAHVDERRAAMGLGPLAQYRANLIRMYAPQTGGK